MDNLNDEMNFPLDNKEVLPKSETTTISKMKLRIYLFLGILGYVVSVMTAYSPVVSDWLKSDEKQMLIKYEQDHRFQAFKDSMHGIENLKLKKINEENRERIYQLMNLIRNHLPTSSQITLYYTHDSGGVPVTGSPLNTTILYTANNVQPCLGRNYWQSRVVPQGYLKMNKKIRDNGLVYIPDTGFDKDLYNDIETREDMDCNNTKSMMGIYLKETGQAVYFLLVSWQHTDPLITNTRSKIILKRYASEITPLIYVKKPQNK